MERLLRFIESLHGKVMVDLVHIPENITTELHSSNNQACITTTDPMSCFGRILLCGVLFGI